MGISASSSVPTASWSCGSGKGAAAMGHRRQQRRVAAPGPPHGVQQPQAFAAAGTGSAHPGPGGARQVQLLAANLARCRTSRQRKGRSTLHTAALTAELGCHGDPRPRPWPRPQQAQQPHILPVERPQLLEHAHHLGLGQPRHVQRDVERLRHVHLLQRGAQEKF